MAEKRKVRRTPAKQRGKALINGKSAVGCTIRDLSPLGARLHFLHPTFLPRTFRLAFDEHDQNVTVIWQAGVLAGVRFQAPIKHFAPQKKKSWFWARG